MAKILTDTPQNPEHPEVENPNEPLWNSMLFIIGIGAMIVFGLIKFVF